MVQKIEISSKTIIFTIAILIFLRVIWLVRELIFGLFLAFILMSALKPAVNKLESLKIPRFIAAFIVFILTLAGFFFVLGVIVPPLVQESILFFGRLPDLISEAFPMINQYFNLNSLTTLIPNITQNAIQVITGIFSNVVFVISVLFFTFYFLIEERFLKNFLDRFIDEKKSLEIVSIVNKAEKRMGAWVWGEVMLMTIIGLFTYMGLLFFQIPYALPLAVLAGILEVVPMVGPIISAIPSIFVGLSISPVTSVYMIALYIFIQQLENNVIVPFVMQRAVGIHPITTLMALTIGGKLGGLMGVILSVPTALFFETVIIEITKKRK